MKINSTVHKLAHTGQVPMLLLFSNFASSPRTAKLSLELRGREQIINTLKHPKLRMCLTRSRHLDCH